jgi:hypothetical protein
MRDGSFWMLGGGSGGEWRRVGVGCGLRSAGKGSVRHAAGLGGGFVGPYRGGGVLRSQRANAGLG